MSSRDTLTTARLLRRRFGTSPLSAILVAVLVLIAAFVAAAVPRLVERQSTAELTYQLESIGPVARSLSGTADFPELWSDSSPSRYEIYGEFDSAFSRARAGFALPLRSALSPAQWLVQTPTIPNTLVNGTPRKLGLRLTGDADYLSRVHIVAGSAPSVWSSNDTDAPSSTPVAPVDIMLSTAAAHSLKVGVGDVIGSEDVDGIPQIRYRVSGEFEPAAASALYWGENPSLVPAFLEKPNFGPSYLAASAFVNPLSVGRLGQTFAQAQIALYYPLAPAAVDGADADLLRGQLAAVLTDGIRIPGEDDSRGMSVTTGSEAAVVTAQQRAAVLSGFLALLASAPLGVTLAVLGLGVQAVVRARRRDIALAMARGATAGQVRLAMAVEGFIVSAPGAIAATVVAAVLIPVPANLADFIPAALVVLSPAVLFAALSAPRDGATSRVGRGRQVRLTAEIAVILLALLALFLLARRGLAQSSVAVGIDPLLVTTPLLLSVSIGILVLRGYPLPLQLARLRAARSRGLAGFVGSIRAARSPTVGLVGVLALVVGISIAIFSTVMLSTFDGATERAAQQSVGADVRVDGSAFTPAQRAAVTAVPGVLAAAGVEHLDPRTLRGSGVIDTVNVMLAQTGALRTLRPRLAPGLASESAGRVPVVVSSDLAGEVRGHAGLTLDGVPVRVVGSLPAASELGLTRSWMLVDSAFADRFTAEFTPDLLLLRARSGNLPHIRSSVAKIVGSHANVVTVQSVADARRSEPAVAGVRLALVLGALISVLLCAIALVLSTIVAGRSRARTAGILRTLGLPSRSLRVLVAWELVPVVIVAVVAGTALGIALPFVLTSAVDLRPFSGGSARPVPLFDPGLVGLVLAAFCLVVAVVGIVAVAAGERLNPSTALKMGAQ